VEIMLLVTAQLKPSHYRPLPVGVGEVGALRIPRQSAHEGGKIVSPKPRPPLPPWRYPGTHFCYEAKSTPGPHAGQKNKEKKKKKKKSQ
jgi:hypothetical protein